MDYSVILLYYKKEKVLQSCINAWCKQILPPKELLIARIESDLIKDYKSTIPIREIVFEDKWKTNLAHKYNTCVDKCNTEGFICTDVDIHPSKQVGVVLTTITNHKSIITPALISVKEYDPDLDLATGKPLFYPVDQYGFPAQFFLAFKDTFLYYNEIYDGDGYFDADLNERMYFDRFKFYRTTECWIQHVRHERPLNDFYSKNVRNKDIFDKIILKYLRNNIRKLENRYYEL